MNSILTVHQCIWDWSDAGNRMDADNNQKDCAINIFTLCLCSFLHITTQQMIGNVRNAMKMCYYIYCMRRRPMYSTDWIGNFLRFNKESLKYCLFSFHIFCWAALCVCRTVIHINHKGCINKVCIEDEWRKLYEHVHAAVLVVAVLLLMFVLMPLQYSMYYFCHCPSLCFRLGNIDVSAHHENVQHMKWIMFRI